MLFFTKVLMNLKPQDGSIVSISAFSMNTHTKKNGFKIQSRLIYLIAMVSGSGGND